MENTYNLILESKEFTSGYFTKCPVAEEDKVIFLSAQERTTPLFTITVDYNPAIRDVRNKHCGWQTVVDISSHIVDVKIEAKAKDHISKFIVALKTDVRVIKPEIIYRDWVIDLTEYVKQNLEEVVAEIADTCDILDDFLLKKQLNEHLRNGLQLGGIEVRIKNVSVDYDSETRDHLKDLLDTKRRKELLIKKQEAAGEIGKNLEDDTGALIEILEGKRPASDIADVRRQLRKNEINDAVEEVTKQVELLNYLMEKGMLSELDGQKAMKDLLPKLSGTSQTSLEEKESEIYAPFYEEENPE